MVNHKQCADAIRVLSMDAVQRANSGHPGMPMGMADIAEVLWREFLHHNPTNPTWPNRDRFIISNGHGSMLLYSLLHLTGYDLTIEDLKQFRQLHSRTPGHPEYGLTPGVATTTGPLGQGISNAVGMAIAERTLAAQFNRPNFPIVDHFTYVFLGDGCMMEGISHEACALAGTLNLHKLIAFWDDNGISIDGEVKGWFTDDTAARFRAYGWSVIGIDGHDRRAIYAAITQARHNQHGPTLICCKTQIAYGSPNFSGTAKAHGCALGDAEVALTRTALGWNYPPFVIPKDIYQAWDAREQGQQHEEKWRFMWQSYCETYPELSAELHRRCTPAWPENFQSDLQKFLLRCSDNATAMATRKASQQCLEHLGPLLPELLGGSADLTDSNLTTWNGSQTITAVDHNGNYIYYGVREFGMSAIMNGIALYGGFIPYGGTFLTFCDYARNAVRMAALMHQRVIFVYTHDSIGLGEDGPTHQPVEHPAMLRMTPNLAVWRPADLVETAVAWQQALMRQKGPTALLLSRQNLPAISRQSSYLEHIVRGGYIVRDSIGLPDVILIATGSELQLAIAAWDALHEEYSVRVVSMPSTDHFAAQPESYRHHVLPPSVRRRLAIEAAKSDYWYKFVGLDGDVMGLDHYGESAPAPALFQAFGFTVENVIMRTRGLLKTKQRVM